MKHWSGYAWVVGLLLMFAIVGCGGGDDGAVDGGSVVAPEVQEGVFLDSPVGGLRYSTDTQAGITDEAGRFHFLPGETVTFSIEDVPLGNARGQEIVTPLDLVDGAEDVTHPTVTNMIRFMQSLDVDADPENGIFIPPHVRDEVDGRPIDFHMGIEDFENHPHVMGLFDTLNGTQAFPHGPVHLRSVEEARDHMREHMGGGFGPGTGQPGGDPVGDMPGVEDGDMPGPGAGGEDMPGGVSRVGRFVDSPVGGLHYETGTQSGITDAEGWFHYREGETVSFSIGDVPMGHALGADVITPMDLVDGAEDVTHPTVTNMIRFMQSLDVDADPENGIFIPPHVRDEVDGRPIDFHMGIEDFENHPHVMGLFDTLNGTQAFPHGPVHLRSVEEARDHMREHMGEGFGPGTGQPGDGRVGDMPVVGGGAGPGRGAGMGPGNMPFG